MKILVTGGTGFIGSHIVIELLNSNYEVVVIDNLSNSHNYIHNKIELITNKKFIFIEGDIRNSDLLSKTFKMYDIFAVIHLAGLKAVGESVKNPLDYYQNNIAGSIALYSCMRDAQVFNLVFSSSATVYGDPINIPIDENHPVGNVTNPYGQTKYINELICHDLVNSNNMWNIGLLRYFNPIGSHPSGLIGENPKDIPNNLMPYILQVASSQIDKLLIYGNDWPTKDGTGVRDYIHVLDLAKAHIHCLEKLRKENIGIKEWNIGTGRGYSVMEILETFERVTKIKIPYEIVSRRVGDIAESWADSTRSNKDLDWKAQYSIDKMVEDSWNWKSKNLN